MKVEKHLLATENKNQVQINNLAEAVAQRVLFAVCPLYIIVVYSKGEIRRKIACKTLENYLHCSNYLSLLKNYEKHHHFPT